MSAETTPQRLLHNSKEHANDPALSSPVNGDWETDTWAEFTSFVMDISKALMALGFEQNDKLSIYSYNRKEWYGCYAAAQMTGGAGVGVYHTCSPEEVEWVVGNSDSKVVFVGNNPMDNGEPDKMPNHRLMKVLDRLDKVEHVVMMNGVGVFESSKAVSYTHLTLPTNREV